jgi:mono/diheme cytochrome c family protein
MPDVEEECMRGVIWFASLCVIAGMALPVSAQTPVERGRYLVEVLGSCGNCHTPKGPQGDLPGKHLAGGFQLDEDFGTWITPNITSDPDTGIGRWTDEEIVRAIRDGRGRDGKTLGPPMPFELYRRLSDNDVRAMVAYLRTVPPIRNVVPRGQYKIPLPPAYGPPVGSVAEPSRQDLVAYGEYLAGPVMHCMACHTPYLPDGRIDTSRMGSGGLEFRGPWGVVYSANLTPDADTGLGRARDGEIIAALYGARRGGGRVLPPMPTQHYAQGIAEGDLRAILAYLRALPPIPNKVPAAVPPKQP